MCMYMYVSRNNVCVYTCVCLCVCVCEHAYVYGGQKTTITSQFPPSIIQDPGIELRLHHQAYITR